ncbi:hypothetical protein L596_010143 [Steinernema carpocapsae]|uniref:Uncharacterized protein n=1 Tax=Steinernema carpocapsae TaxID=34508 RepID=A0A4U5PHZ7_STECR|nr:hypothetical protein L596_010143 [Steinernema carpocapsae]
MSSALRPALFSTAFSCFFALLGSVTSTVSIRGTNCNFSIHFKPHSPLDPFCNASELRHNFLHAVTCRGYLRFPIGEHSLAEMNQEIDRILEASKDVNNASSCSEVKAFYFNESAWIFFKFPDFGRQEEPNFDRLAAYWIEDLRGKEGQFVPFPPSDEWISLGEAYSREDFEKLSKDEKKQKSAICDPFVWFYDKSTKAFRTLNFKEAIKIGDPFARREELMMCDQNEKSSQVDPIVDKHNVTDVGTVWSLPTETPRDVFHSQVYATYHLRSERETDGYHALFWRSNSTQVEDFLKGERDEYPWGNYCHLRRYRLEFHELPQAFILPKNEQMPFLDSIPEATESFTPSFTKANRVRRGVTKQLKSFTTTPYPGQMKKDKDDYEARRAGWVEEQEKGSQAVFPVFASKTR